MDLLHRNMLFASDVTLKKYSPIWKYGMEPLEDFLATVPSNSSECVSQKSAIPMADRIF